MYSLATVCSSEATLEASTPITYPKVLLPRTLTLGARISVQAALKRQSCSGTLHRVPGFMITGCSINALSTFWLARILHTCGHLGSSSRKLQEAVISVTLNRAFPRQRVGHRE